MKLSDVAIVDLEKTLSVLKELRKELSLFEKCTVVNKKVKNARKEVYIYRYAICRDQYGNKFTIYLGVGDKQFSEIVEDIDGAVEALERLLESLRSLKSIVEYDHKKRDQHVHVEHYRAFERMKFLLKMISV